MKKINPALAVVAVLILVWLLFPKTKTPAPNASADAIASAKYSAAVARALTTAPPAAVATIESNFARITASPAPAPAARVIPDGRPFAPEVTNMEPQIVLEIVSRAIRNYGQRFGGNPVGSNAEITRALGGGNPGSVNFIADTGMRVNDRGELIDAWGTPFFFHQLSGTEMEIHSAGADKILWTADDLVTR